MDKVAFEAVLEKTCKVLTAKMQNGELFAKSSDFELAVRNELANLLAQTELEVDFNPHPHVFPDICMPPYGVEVKFSIKDTWRSVANSIFESSRDSKIEEIYVIFGKQGGAPAVNWGSYGESIVHVRTSHLPRFEVEVPPSRSLFENLGINYTEFAKLTLHERMIHIREYARGRLKNGEKLWWINDPDDAQHTLPLQVRLYTSLEQEEKRRIRAEAAVLCPQVVKPSRSRGKYDEAVLYILTAHGVICSQARDLFSAGSVALRSDGTRGGNYIERSLRDIEEEMKIAMAELEPALFLEYWGVDSLPNDKLKHWLTMADDYAKDWVPSATLFH